jgi:hypothetical protein
MLAIVPIPTAEAMNPQASLLVAVRRIVVQSWYWILT